MSLTGPESNLGKLEILIGLGSNLGDRRNLVLTALDRIEMRGHLVRKRAKLYRSEPTQGCRFEFLNTCALIETGLSPQAFLAELQAIESELGRDRTSSWPDRTIDLDILLIQNAGKPYPAIDSLQLSVPHPRMLDRSFVMDPACEIAGDWKHPGTDQELRFCRRDHDLGFTFVRSADLVASV